jgi:hypothetical protein
MDRFVTLSTEQCLDVLRRERVARVAVSHRALPAIASVIYAMDGDAPVFRAPRDGVLAKACVNAVVALGVDDSPAGTTNGSAVLVVGLGAPMTNRERLCGLGFDTQSEDGQPRDVFVAIQAAVITGQREAQPGCVNNGDQHSPLPVDIDAPRRA